MLITIISVFLIVLAIILFALPERAISKWHDTLISIISVTAVAALVIGGLGTMISVGAIIGNHVNSDIQYQNKLYERDVLEYRIDHLEDDLTGNELIYNDIVTFNNALRQTKRDASSLWLNWFTNQDVAALDYVELPSN